MNLGASLGIAIREFPLETGFADYLLFVNRKAVGVVEAKAKGVTLSGVVEQTAAYLTGLPKTIPHVQLPLPFGYESTGVETFFTDNRDPEPRAHRLFAFHRPETLQEWIHRPDTLRARLRAMPEEHPLATTGLRECQIEAITNLEHSFAMDKPRALIQMATGAGKTFTAVSFIYRLIKFGGAKRVVFLVDRNNLGRQTLREFQQYVTPDDGRKFTELYNVQHLTSNTLDPVCRVCITTIQRLYSMLTGKELESDDEEHSLFDEDVSPAKSKEVVYNPTIPIEYFDFIISDECHRSIYTLWRQVLEYFDAYIIGLTATPSKQTFGFFNQNLVMEYSHDRAVCDGVNVGFDVFRIKTAISENGSTVESGYYIDKRDKGTREVRWEQLDEDFTYTSKQLNRDVVSPNQIRTIIRTFKDHLFTDLFPNRKEVPKTLVFARDDSHAEDIVQIIREEFGRGNEFCKKITYRSTGEKPEELIASFRNSYYPRIAVSVDMIATGTDIKPLECLLFMRDVRSPVYFDQMKGRGTRTISPTDLQAVTPDATHKTHFVVVDAVGVCESEKNGDTRSLERKRTVPFRKLMDNVALGIRDVDTLSSLANRIARLDREVEEKDRTEIASVSGGLTLTDIAGNLLDAISPDKPIDVAKERFATEHPTPEQVQEVAEELVEKACTVFDSVSLRKTLEDIKARSEQVIDTVSPDTVLFAGYDEKARERAATVVKTWEQFLEENRNEITALQIIFNQPYGKRRLTFEEVKELANAIEKPPYHLTQEAVWQAYEQLERAKVKGAGTTKLLTNIISLVRFTLHESDVLAPYPDDVNQRFEAWLDAQETTGRRFTPEQLEWLQMIKNHIATSVSIEADDFDYAPFSQKGGILRAYRVFGGDLNTILAELNEALTV